MTLPAGEVYPLNDKEYIETLAREEITLLEKARDSLVICQELIENDDLEAFLPFWEKVHTLYNQIIEGPLSEKKKEFSSKHGKSEIDWGSLWRVAKDADPSLKTILKDLYSANDIMFQVIRKKLETGLATTTEKISHIDTARKIKLRYSPFATVPKESIFIDKKK